MDTTAALTKSHTRAHSRCEDIDTVLTWMNGNGKPGAKTRLALLEDSIERMERKQDKILNWIVGIAVTFIGAVLIWLFTNLLPKIIGHVG